MLPLLSVFLFSESLAAPPVGKTTYEVSVDAALDAPKIRSAWKIYALALQDTVSAAPEMYARYGRITPRFADELAGRARLAQGWRELGGADPYLDALVRVDDAGFLREYVWVFLRGPDWVDPGSLNLTKFTAWKSEHLTDHHVETHGWLSVRGSELVPDPEGAKKVVKEAKLAYEQGDRAKLVALVAKALRLDPENADALWIRGIVLIAEYRRVKDPDAHARLAQLITADLQAVIRVAPGSMNASLARNELHHSRGLQLPKARCSSAANTAFSRAETLFEERKLRDAAAAYDEGLALCPQNANMWVYSGDALFGVGDAGGAMDRYRKAIEIAPCHWQAHRFLADVYLTLHQGPAALAELGRAVACNPGYEPAWTAAARSAVRVYSPQPVWEAGGSTFGKVTSQLRPEPVYAAWRKSYDAYHARGSADAALASLRDAVKVYRRWKADRSKKRSAFWEHMDEAEAAGFLREAMLVQLFSDDMIPEFTEYRASHYDQLLQYVNAMAIHPPRSPSNLK